MPPIDRLKSPFQRRMLRDDFRSTLFTQIADHAPNADIVLLDIVDDRLGVIEYYPNRFVTLSAELSSSGWLAGDRALRRRRLQLGDPDHFARFTLAAARVKDTLISSGAWERTLMIRATYATRAVEGDILVGDYGIGPDEWNRRYAAYYDVLEDLGFAMITPRGEFLFSSRNHQWGMHPIHYHHAASLDLVNQMIAARGNAPGSQEPRCERPAEVSSLSSEIPSTCLLAPGSALSSPAV